MFVHKFSRHLIFLFIMSKRFDSSKLVVPGYKVSTDSTFLQTLLEIPARTAELAALSKTTRPCTEADLVQALVLLNSVCDGHGNF